MKSIRSEESKTRILLVAGRASVSGKADEKFQSSSSTEALAALEADELDGGFCCCCCEKSIPPKSRSDDELAAGR